MGARTESSVPDVPVIRTPDRRLRVFVSSTLRELEEERRAVRAAIESLRLTPVMFELGARPYPPRELYRAYLDQSDLFLGIYAASYGWVAPDMDISGLEDEYWLSEGLPRLVYVRRDEESVDPRLEALLAHIALDGVSFRLFATAEELGDLVRDDLAVLLTERFELSAAQRSGVEDRAEREILATGREIEADVLKAPHHGSIGAARPAFIEAVNPRVAFFPTKAGAAKFPAEETLSRYRRAGALCLAAGEKGAAVVDTDGRRLRVRTMY